MKNLLIFIFIFISLTSKADYGIVKKVYKEKSRNILLIKTKNKHFLSLKPIFYYYIDSNKKYIEKDSILLINKNIKIMNL